MKVMSYHSDREMMMISVVNSVQDVELALRRYDFKCPIISYVIMWDELYDLHEWLWMCWAETSRSVLHHCAVCSARAPAFVARRVNRFEAVLAGPASHFDALTSFFIQWQQNTACLQCQPNIDNSPWTLNRLLFATVEIINAILYIYRKHPLCVHRM